MPEGHSIRRIANAFEELFLGRRCQVSSPQGRFAAGAALIDGQVMGAVRAKGKHLFLGFGEDDSLWLHAHLGLYGSWLFQGPRVGATHALGAPRKIDPDRAEIAVTTEEIPPPRGAVRARIIAEGVVADLTGPTTCAVLTTQEMQAVVRRLGPDPIAERSERDAGSRFIQAIRSSRRPVGELVMDQSVIAGVGNIYRAEGLFRQGISPKRAGNRVSEQRLWRLWDDFGDLLADGVEDGKIVTVRGEPPLDDPESSSWYVYHRGGRPCLVCGNPVKVEKAAGRDLFWCPTCQR